eukprot:m.40138 g.40138  ORF g.40138 m.40138 type:complete len:340 (+) comp12728_c0_seq1:6-1025(+)
MHYKEQSVSWQLFCATALPHLPLYSAFSLLYPPNSTMYGARNNLIIKVRLGNDVRRLAVPNAELTYDDLIPMLHRIFRPTGKLPSDDFVLKYQDEDGDLITMVDNQDLNLATANTDVLRLTICTESDELHLNPTAVDGIHQQLQTVCTAVNTLVRRLDQVSVRDQSKPTPRPSTSGNGSKPSLSLDGLSMAPSSTASSVLGTPKAKPVDTSAFQAFDPLSGKGSPSNNPRPVSTSSSGPSQPASMSSQPQTSMASSSQPGSSYATMPAHNAGGPSTSYMSQTSQPSYAGGAPMQGSYAPSQQGPPPTGHPQGGHFMYGQQQPPQQHPQQQGQYAQQYRS